MWPFRRRAADAPAPADAADDVLRPARADWRTVEPLRPVQAMSLSTIDRGFEQSLATRAQPLFIESLSHHVHPTAPAGTVDGLAVPSPGLADGVVRSYAAPATTAQRITSAAPTAVTPAPPPTVDSSPTAPTAPTLPTAIAAPPSRETVVASRAPVIDPAPVVDASPSPDVAAVDEAPPDVDDADGHVTPAAADDVTERPLLDERAPLVAIAPDDHAALDVPAAPEAGGRSIEPPGPLGVQRRIDLSTPTAPRPAMRIGAPIPPTTDRTLIGQREAPVDDGPLTSVTRGADAAPAADVASAPRLGAPLVPGVAIQRTAIELPVVVSRDDTVSEAGVGDDVEDAPIEGRDAAGVPTVDAPLVGAAPLGPATTPDGAAAPPRQPSPAPTVAAPGPTALQRTEFDTPTPIPATPRMTGVSGAHAPTPVVSRSLAREAVEDGPAAGPAPFAAVDAPLVGAADPLVDHVDHVDHIDHDDGAVDRPLTSTVAGPGAPPSEVIVETEWSRGSPTDSSAPGLDGGLLGDRPPTLTIDWSDGPRRADAPAAVSGRTDVAARSSAPSPSRSPSPPVVARQLAAGAAPGAATASASIRAAESAPPGRAPVLQFGPPPTTPAPVLSFATAPVDTGERSAAGPSFELPVALQRELLGDPEPSVQRAPDAMTTVATAEPTPAPSAAPGAVGAGGRSEAELVELARVLYPQLQRRLARDLLLDRERAGYRTDIRF